VLGLMLQKGSKVGTTWQDLRVRSFGTPEVWGGVVGQVKRVEGWSHVAEFRGFGALEDMRVERKRGVQRRNRSPNSRNPVC
jgi:hypothetical protein